MKIKTRKEKRRKIAVITYVLLTLLLLIDVMVIPKYGISLAGYWSDRILFWIWGLATLPFWFFSGKVSLQKSTLLFYY